MIPYAYALSLPAVDIEALWTAGFRGMIVDVDNTLVGFDSAEASPAVTAWILAAKARGFRIVFLSNNFRLRVGRVATALDCEGVPNALKPLPFGFLSAMRMLKTTHSETVIVGDQLMTDILGALLVGVRGVLVNPIAEKDFPLTRVFRVIERLVIGARRPTL